LRLSSEKLKQLRSRKRAQKGRTQVLLVWTRFGEKKTCRKTSKYIPKKGDHRQSWPRKGKIRLGQTPSKKINNGSDRAVSSSLSRKKTISLGRTERQKTWLTVGGITTSQTNCKPEIDWWESRQKLYSSLQKKSVGQ